MDFQKVKVDYLASFKNDLIVPNWDGHSLKIQRVQEWDNGRFLTPDMDVRDIYLDMPWIAAGWRKVYGTPKLSDFVKPDKTIVSVKDLKYWRVNAGRDECQWMTAENLAVIDVAQRLVCGKYPRGINNRFVNSDAGCKPGNSCPGHGGAHDRLDVIDGYYCTLRGFNMTQSHRKDMPMEYLGGKINFWRDPFPQRIIRTDIFDTEKNYALFEQFSGFFDTLSILVSNGILQHFQEIYGHIPDCIRGDDNEFWKHFWHWHMYMLKIKWNAEVK